MEQFWREHFIIEEDMLEVQCTCLTPEPVLKASGHVDKFADLLVTDVITRQGHRADKLITEFLETKLAKEKLTPEVELEIKKVLSTIDGLKKEDMAEVITKYKIKAPET